MVDPRTTDMWWYSRQKTAQYRGELPERFIRWVTQSLPGLRTKQVPIGIRGFGATASGYGVDLNKYRPKVNVEMLYDMGIRIFDLRMFGPTQWVYNDWKYEMDVTFPDYYTRIRKLPDAIIGGYGVHNAWMDEESGYTSNPDPQVTLLKLYAKNFPCDYYTWDDEVGQCYKNGNPNTIITGVNLTKSIANVLRQTLEQMEKWPNRYFKIPERYGANWFDKQYGGDTLLVWMDSNQKDPSNLWFLNWKAWIPTTFSQTFPTPQALFDKVIIPNGVQENAYLRYGSGPLAVKWQCTWNMLGPWCLDGKGIDASITYGLGAALSDYKYLHNMPVAVPPPDPGSSGTVPPGDYITRLEFEDYKKHVHAFDGVTK